MKRNRLQGHSQWLWSALLIFVTGLSPVLAAPKGFFLNGNKAEEEWEAKQGEEDPIAVLMTGDMMLGRYIATLRERNGGDFPFTYMPEVIDAVETALNVDKLDIIAGNLEGPIVEQQVAYGDLVFRFAPEVAPLLKKVGFTTLQLSNNHTFNQTRAGFTETVNHLHNAGVDGFGHPDTVNGEWSVLRYDFNRTSLAFLGFNDTDFKLNMEEALAKIKELDAQVDVLIVGIHWGFEYEPTARESMVNKAHQFVDAGADFIWGTHPHVIQNHEQYNGKWIYYSLGNFVFDQYWSAPTQEGLVLGLKIEDQNGTLTLTPAEIYVDLVNKGEPKPRSY